MLTGVRNFMLAAAAAIVVPFAAGAVTISNDVNVGNFYSFTSVIQPGGDVEFKFNVLDHVKIDGFAIAATASGRTGAQASADIADVTFGFSLPATNNFTTTGSFGNVAFGGGFLTGGVYKPGTSFSIFFQDGIVNDVGLTLSFATTAVPLPAAGLLLAPVLVAGGVAAARRRKALAKKA